MAREEKKKEILRAAAKVFFVNGFEGAKIEDIAKEAGIGKGTVYEYFDSKQQLFEEMVAYSHQIIIGNLKKALAQGDSFNEKIKAFASFLTGMLKDHLHLFELMANSKVMAREMGALILESNIRMGDALMEVVAEAARNGEIRSGLDPEIITAMIMGTVNQYCSKKVVFYMKQPEEIDYDLLVDAIMRGIGR